MATKDFNITVHMVSSLDGYIAKKNNDIAWFEASCDYAGGVKGDDPIEFLKTIDCYVMGSATYELAMELAKSYGWAYGDKPTYVVTTRTLPVPHEHIHFYSGDVQKLVDKHLKPNYKNVWLVGGPTLVGEFMRLQLAHEIRISILPILLGEGLLFFDQLRVEQRLQLKNVTAYKNGMVELRYGLLSTPG